MKIIRSDVKLSIEIEEDNDGFEILFPSVARFHCGFSKFEIVADDLEHILSKVDHYLAKLASNALDAEWRAMYNDQPRWLVYNADGSSYETSFPVEGAPMVEYKGGKFVWTNPGEEEEV